MNYDRNIVLMAFRAVRESNHEPAESTLVKFDEGLHSDFEDELKKQTKAAGIPYEDEPFNRNILVFFACVSKASKNSTKVAHAIKYFEAVAPKP